VRTRRCRGLGIKRSSLASAPICPYDTDMEPPLSPDIQSMIRHHLAHGCSPSPESVIRKALHALDEQEAEAAQHEEACMETQKEAPQPSPLLQWLRDTSGPATDLEALRRRLARIPDSLSDAMDEERQDRF